MEEPKRILFVCTGNICRSAMAEHLLRHRARTQAPALEVASCGVAAESWYRVPEAARRQLALRGVPPFEHRPRLASRESLRWADLVLTMTEAHRDQLLDAFPEFGRKLGVLRAYAGLGRTDVADPMGRPESAFAAALADIEEALEVLLTTRFLPPADR